VVAAVIDASVSAGPDAEMLKRLYSEMFRIRAVEEAIAARYHEQEMRCPVHLSIGQEAIAVGVCAGLQHDEFATSAHRSHANYLAKGGNLNAMLAELYGKVTGCCKGHGGSMHLIDRSVGFLGAVPIVGSAIPIAVGAAFGSALLGTPRVAVAFFGEAAVEEGVFHEALNFAALKQLPVLFVCENNGFSVMSPLEVRQPANREVASLARGHGVESHQGDGNDVTEVYRLAQNALRKARRGDGPTFLEFKTSRWREHCGPNYDHEMGYRSMAEFEAWTAKCPVARLAEQLQEQSLLASHEHEVMAERVAAEIAAAFAFAQASPFPEPHSLHEHVYAS
jgi:TPP-dependent pyruvate/acetoin dehydrogenase alpha subunit